MRVHALTQMKMRMLSGKQGRILFFRMIENDDVAEATQRFAEEAGVKAGFFIIIGALKKAILGCYKDGNYEYIEIQGPIEIASCMGNIAVDEKQEIAIHAHMVVSKETGEALGGHLMKGCQVGPTAELVVIEAKEVKLTRVFDARTRLRLLNLG